MVPNTDGGFVVAWTTTSNSYGGGAVYIQKLDELGARIGSPTLVDGSGGAFKPELEILTNGNIALVYAENHSGIKDTELRIFDQSLSLLHSSVVDPSGFR